MTTQPSAASVDIGLDALEQAIADSVAAYCRDRCSDQVVRAAYEGFPLDLWRGLGELGVLGLGACADAGTGVIAMCAAVEQLGRALFPGPLAATYLAVSLLEGAELEAVAAGRSLVAFGTPPLLPWLASAQIVLVIDGETVARARPRGSIEAVDTLGGEPWGRADLEIGEELAGGPRGLAVYAVALAAYLAAAARALVEVTAEHARTRKQFGKPIGDFQSVAHPLAECALRLGASASLARSAAFDLDRGVPGASAKAVAARWSANHSAVVAAEVCHQMFGAMGATTEGPVFPYSRRIRQLASLPPSRAQVEGALLQRYGI